MNINTEAILFARKKSEDYCEQNLRLLSKALLGNGDGELIVDGPLMPLSALWEATGIKGAKALALSYVNDAALRFAAENAPLTYPELKPQRYDNLCDAKDFNFKAFYEALDMERLNRACSWSHLSKVTGIGTSTLSRMREGRHPNAASIVALAKWAGLDLASFLTEPKQG